MHLHKVFSLANQKQKAAGHLSASPSVGLALELRP